MHEIKANHKVFVAIEEDYCDYDEHGQIVWESIHVPDEEDGIIMEDVDYGLIDNHGEVDGKLYSDHLERGDISEYNNFYEQQFPDHQRTVHCANKILRHGKEWKPTPKMTEDEKKNFNKMYRKVKWQMDTHKKYQNFLWLYPSKFLFNDDFKSYLKKQPLKQRILIKLSKMMWYSKTIQFTLLITTLI
jgi:hypothetical protein